MVESGPGLRSGLTADIRACLKMHLKIKKGEESSQSKGNVCKAAGSRKAQETKN